MTYIRHFKKKFPFYPILRTCAISTLDLHGNYLLAVTQSLNFYHKIDWLFYNVLVQNIAFGCFENNKFNQQIMQIPCDGKSFFILKGRSFHKMNVCGVLTIYCLT